MPNGGMHGYDTDDDDRSLGEQVAELEKETARLRKAEAVLRQRFEALEDEHGRLLKKLGRATLAKEIEAFGAGGARKK